MARKAILVAMADRANDDGTGIWVSKARIAEECECRKETVISNIRELVAEGLLREAGRERCTNGYTVRYDIHMPALLSLPESRVKKEENPSQDKAEKGPVEKPTGQKADPKQSEIRPQEVRLPNPNRPEPLPSSSSDVRRDAIDRILAACGPGMVDGAKTATPMLDLAARIDRWLAAWDLETEILPVIDLKTRNPRTRPMHDFRFIEQDIAAFHAKKILEIPVVELSNERTGQGQSGRNANGRGHMRAGAGGEHRTPTFDAAYQRLFGGDQAQADVSDESFDGRAEWVA